MILVGPAEPVETMDSELDAKPSNPQIKINLSIYDILV
jgi:hypothetical protein